MLEVENRVVTVEPAKELSDLIAYHCDRTPFPYLARYDAGRRALGATGGAHFPPPAGPELLALCTSGLSGPPGFKRGATLAASLDSSQGAVSWRTRRCDSAQASISPSMECAGDGIRYGRCLMCERRCRSTVTLRSPLGKTNADGTPAASVRAGCPAARRPRSRDARPVVA